ncbi:MAG TPA: phosphoribosylanthranilate isomerase [Methylocystis sp.]|nr:phosphoribosylanthranilate isomerase [Methylocystis sp.]
MPQVIVKICGLSTPETLEAAIAAGADMAGFMFYQKSPRHIDPATARRLGQIAADRIQKVALSVDADDAALAAMIEALAPDYLQLHGSETPERVAAVKARFGLAIIKAIGVASAADVASSAAYGAADMLIFDAKPAPDASLPGGNGVVFDWRLMHGAAPGKPWLLSGGLDEFNVAEAIGIVGAPGVDVSSGVERARGVKDVGRIAAFVAAARKTSADSQP